jgi:hypothetical protein
MKRSLHIRFWVLGAAVLAVSLAAGARETPPAGQLESEPEAPLLISPDAIEMPEDLRQLLGDVSDAGAWHQKGLTELVDHVRTLETLSFERIQDLESPSHAKLLAAPRAYRAQAIRLSFVPRTVTRVEPSSQFPADQPFWVLRGFFHRQELAWSQPVIVVTAFDPGQALPEPTRFLDDGTGVYESPKLYRLNVVGVFFKISQAPGEDLRTGETIDMPPAPVVVAWQRYRIQAQARPTSYQLPVIIAAVVVAVVGFFYIARRYLRQLKHNRKRESPVQRYRRERQAREETSEQEDESDEEDPPVDPSLIEAASQYRKEHRIDESDR